MRKPALCELLPVREYLDGVMVQVDGSLVAGYELTGLNSFYHDDDMRNRSKHALEALIRSLPERSMRLQMRFEITEGIGDARTAYPRLNRNENPVLQEIDRLRMQRWDANEARGYYMRHLLHAYFIWNPRIHHELAEKLQGKKTALVQPVRARSASIASGGSTKTCLSEFSSLLAGVEQTLVGTGMRVRRMTDEEMFLEAKRALNPAFDDRSPLRRAEYSLTYRSARGQITNTSIEDEQENYLQSRRAPIHLRQHEGPAGRHVPGNTPRAACSGLPDHRQCRGHDPRPDQDPGALQGPASANAGGATGFTRRVQDQRRGAGRAEPVAGGPPGGDLLFAEGLQLLDGDRRSDLQSRSSAARTSRRRSERLNDRRQRVVHAVTRMNGARAIPESLAQRRLFIGSLPGMGQENKRDLSCLTLHGADLLPIEMPWQGTPQSPLILLETPYRQLIPFSPYDPSMGDANMLFMAKSGGGKTFMAQMFLLMMARANPLISIIERGDSYRPLVELMGGRVIEVDLEGSETLNPWDLPPGEIQPTKDKIAFLKNLTRHMIGDLGQSDTSLLDNILSEAIAKVYKRVCGSRRQQDADLHGSPERTLDLDRRRADRAYSAIRSVGGGGSAPVDGREGRLFEAVRPPHHDPDGCELAVLQHRGAERGFQTRNRDEHADRTGNVRARIGKVRAAFDHGAG